MKKVFIFTILMFCSFSEAFASNLHCEVKINETLALKQSVVTSIGQKTTIGDTSQIRSFVTDQGNQVFVLEAFLGDEEARIYSRGSLKATSDKLDLSFWGRDVLYDMQCSRIN